MLDDGPNEDFEFDRWRKYKETRDSKIRETFIKQYAPLVRCVASDTRKELPKTVDYDDLVGFGVFGLIDAIDKFDQAKHVEFKTYAVMRIRDAIFDELHLIDWKPREVEEAIIIMRLESKLGHQESNRDVAAALSELPEKEKKVLFLYYYENRTYEEIGKVLNVTRNRVSELHYKAILHLKSQLK